MVAVAALLIAVAYFLIQPNPPPPTPQLPKPNGYDEARTNDAVGIYLDSFRFSHEAFRGGLMIHKAVGLACEALAMRPWQQIIPSLSTQQCREAIQTLEAIEAKSETLDEVTNNEKSYFRRAEGFRHKLTSQISAMILTRSLQPFKAGRQRLEQNYKKIQTQRRLLMVDLAVHAYKLEKGERPKSFADLVPAHLQSIPQDPGTGSNLFYRFWKPR